jgi:hypothetical protein
MNAPLEWVALPEFGAFVAWLDLLITAPMNADGTMDADNWYVVDPDVSEAEAPGFILAAMTALGRTT